MAKSKEIVPRDVSWLYFNHRILQEAQRNEVPLLERLSFLGIYSNNQDEFFRVRMATLSRIATCEEKKVKKTAEETLKTVTKLLLQYAKEYEETIATVRKELRAAGFYIIREDEINGEQRAFLNTFYRERLSGETNALWLSSVKHLSDENDNAIYMVVKLREEGKKKFSYTILSLPTQSLSRFVRLPDSEGYTCIMYLDDVVRFCLPMIFAGLGYCDYKAWSFKFTKDAEMELDNDHSVSMMQKIQKGVKSRKKGGALRLVYDSEMPKDVLKHVLERLDINKKDTVIAGGRYHNHKDFMKFPDCNRADLKYPEWKPIMKPELTCGQSLLEQIQKYDRFIHVPYHSFDQYIRLLQEAAVSKQVKGIKTTLYRLAKDSRVVKALICAAQNGKQVTVVIELLARFDEAPNIVWAKALKEAGAEVLYGVEGLKVHSKITHISLRKGTDIACISTGNFHEGNARCYTDYMLMTATKQIVLDVNKVFTFIEKPYQPVKFKELFVSPNDMKTNFLRLIATETKAAINGKEAWIKMKVNHITDEDMVAALYEAANAGVKLDLLVRGNCSLVTKWPNMQVRGIIDRYLEHSRIFIFFANGEEKTFIGSADWMPRNLTGRIEVVTPIYDKEIKSDLKHVIELGMLDTCSARIIDGHGGDALAYVTEFQTPVPVRSQEELYKYYSLINNKKE